MTGDEIIAMLGLVPLAQEGGYFRRTYESAEKLASGQYAGTAIYYLVTPTSFSSLHRLPQEELFHFYLGDPVEMIQLTEAGVLTRHRLGSDLRAGERPQCPVPGNVWQGTRLVDGGAWALLGATVVPGFEWRDFETATRPLLLARFPAHRADIERFTCA